MGGPSPTDSALLDAISDQAAVLDPAGVVILANAAWQQAPSSHCQVLDRSPIGTDYPAALRSQTQSQPARIAAEGIDAVLAGALPGFHSEYDTDVDAAQRAYSLHADPLPTGGAVIRHIDISFRKHLQRQLAHRATHDALTGLPNRTVIVDRLGQALVRAARTRSTVSLLFCDVDRFKQINDAHGHTVGDQVLADVARRLQEAVRQSDVVARFGGDEFIVLLEDTDGEGALEFATQLQTAATRPVVVEGRPLHFGLSVGVATHAGTDRPDPSVINALLADADAAMYAAKQSGRGNIRMFDPANHKAKPDPALIASALRTAARNDQIRMMVQPVVDLTSGHVEGFETLVRWDLPDVGLLSPADFLQTAEETGAIIEIGRSILRQSLGFARTLPAEQWVSVNVSWVELAQSSYATDVLEALAMAGVPPRRLSIEVVLPAVTQPQPLRQLRDLRAAGVGVTLDAFGRQPVELTLIPRMGASTVKVDRALTAFATTPGPAARMLRGIVDLAGVLGLTCIAEGVESTEQAQAVAAVGFQHGQGFFFGKPADPAELMPSG